jgi:hypothetical protein
MPAITIGSMFDEISSSLVSFNFDEPEIKKLQSEPISEALALPAKEPESNVQEPAPTIEQEPLSQDNSNQPVSNSIGYARPLSRKPLATLDDQKDSCETLTQISQESIDEVMPEKQVKKSNSMVRFGTAWNGSLASKKIIPGSDTGTEFPDGCIGKLLIKC